MDVGKPVAGAAVVALRRAVRGDEVLLVRRGREPRRGDWSLPGGSIEPGETAREAAAREAFEETGLRLLVHDVVDVFDAIFPPAGETPGFHYVVPDFLAEPEDTSSEPLAGDDALEARWVPIREVDVLAVSDAVRAVVRRALWLREQRRPGWLGAHSAVMEAARTELRPPGAGEGRCRDYFEGGLYAITENRGTGRGHVEVASAALAGGARVLQLRDKAMDGGPMLEMVRRLATMAREAGALILVNDRVDVALAAEADGVHLGQTDLPVHAARAMLGPKPYIGVSVETPEQARQAEAEGADYVGVGAIYGSATKPDAGESVGLEHLRRVRAATRLPIVAIGGITAERAGEVIGAGADSVAVISAISAAPEMEAAARQMAERCRSAWEERRM